MARQLKEYVQYGGNAIDTANIYHLGASEKLLGQLVSQQGLDRDDMVIASKYTGSMDFKKPNYHGNHKKNMIQAVDASLKRMDLDYLDILYVHFWDHSMKAEDLIRDLDAVLRTGKVLHIGISDTAAWQVCKANMWAQDHGRELFTVYQGRYSIIDRSLEQDVMPMCDSFRMKVVNWGVFGQGKLTGKRSRNHSNHNNDHHVSETGAKRNVPVMSEAEFLVQDEVVAVARECERTPTQIALRWSIEQPTIASTLIGPRTPQQLRDSMKALEFELTAEQRARLESVSHGLPAPIFPHSMLGTNIKNTPMTKMAQYPIQL